MSGDVPALGAVMRRLFLCSLFVTSLLLLLLLPATADDTILSDQNTGEIVLLTPERTQRAADVSPSVVGLWPHGDGRDDDAMFFRQEDAAYEEWATRQRLLRQQQKQGAETGNEREEKRNSAKTMKSDASKFTLQSVKARAEARQKRLKKLETNSSFEDALGIIRVDADHVHQLLYENSLNNLNETPGATPEEQYLHLLKNAFRHTARNMTNAQGVAWLEEWIFALPYPIVLGEETLGLAEREVRSLTRDVAKLEASWRLASASNKDSMNNVSVTQVKEGLRDSADILSSSRRAHQMVFELVLPLLDHARQSVHSQLREINTKILGNDESTTLLRQQLKEWTKRKGSLKFSKEQIENLERKVRKASYGRTLLSKDAFVMALALIARLRLEQNTGIEAVDVITDMGFCMGTTSTLESELKELFFYPLGMGVLVAATVGWVLLATRAFWLKRVVQSTTREKRALANGGRPRRRYSVVRLGLQVNLLVESVMPLVIPCFFLYLSLEMKTSTVSLYYVFLFARPAQRCVLIILVILGLVLSVIVSSLMGVLYRLTSGFPQQKKIKNS